MSIRTANLQMTAELLGLTYDESKSGRRERTNFLSAVDSGRAALFVFHGQEYPMAIWYWHWHKKTRVFLRRMCIARMSVKIDSYWPTPNRFLAKDPHGVLGGSEVAARPYVLQ